MNRLASRQGISSRRLAWLRGELVRWQAAGLVDAATAADIEDGYVVSRRMSLARLLLLLGAGFVGIGLVWLVAANLEELSPLVRFTGITAVWLAGVAAAEILGHRQERPSDEDAPAVAAARLVAVLAYGGVVFQAAQSLQVPAYHSGLLGIWGAGALAYAYASGGVAALVVAIAAAGGWYVWTVGEGTDSGAAVAVALVAAACVAASVAVLHRRRWRPRFAAAWTVAGALLALGGLFIAALPGMAPGDAVPAVLWGGLAAAAAAGAAAALFGDRWGRLEVLAVAAMVAAGFVLAWSAGPSGLGQMPAGWDLARALVATAVYVAAAAWFATVGVLRETPAVTGLATAALVLFVTVQSFAVFAPLLSGAALFLVLGAVFLLTGMLATRGRRRLATRVAEAAE